MKIVKITSTPLSIGKSLVRIETDSGITGYSEAFSSNAPSSNGKSSIIFDTYLEEYINPLLIGENPLEIDRHWETLALGKSDKLYKLPAQIVGTIDIALSDTQTATFIPLILKYDVLLTNPSGLKEYYLEGNINVSEGYTA